MPRFSPEHAVVLVEGQSPCGIFILCQGRAKLSTASREGKTLIIRIAEPVKFWACTRWLPADAVRVETMQPCQLDYVGRDDMLRFLKDHADAALRATQPCSRLF
jgi:CRP/FNR family cyclic AMP-dependent transcriptional regulator